jgi:basic membrane protein A and related proteins
MKFFRQVAALVAVGVIALACGSGGGGSSGGTASSCSKTWKVGLVTDVGKLSDKSFNATSWKGVQDAQADKSLCVQGRAIESNQPTDYQKNMQTFVDQNYDMVIAVGFLMTDDVLAVAKANPKVKFAIVDGSHDNPPANLTDLLFREDQAGFLAGALAGLYTKSNVVAGVYGIDIPPVHKYRVGFENGAKYTNKNVETRGIYQGAGPKAFNDPDWGKQQGITFADGGADLIFGAGGNTGNGALLAAQQKGKTCIGVDVDQFESYPEVQSCLITSAEKKLAVAVKAWITSVVKGTVKNGTSLFDASNGGVGLAPFHNFDSKVTSDEKAKLQDIEKQLASGALKTGAET